MLDDLDKTLRQLLAEAGFGEHQISFKPPDDAVASDTSPAVNLFLYDVRENRELRSNEWLRERQANGTVTRRRSPVRVDCAYLITAVAGDPLSEHRLLGQVMLALLRHPTIPASMLQGSLQGHEPLPTSALQASNLQSLSEFWQAMGNKARAVLNYTVTISVDPYEPVTAPPVFEHIIAIQQTNGDTKA
jgi:hypothetical protein